MQALIRVVRALALLAGIWGAIALVGWLAHAFPPKPTSAAAETQPAHGNKTAGGGKAAKAGAAGAKQASGKTGHAASKAGAPAAATTPQPPSLPTRTAGRYTACDPTVVNPSLTVAQMVGDPRPEVAIGCGSLVQVLGASPGSDGSITPVRVLAFDAAPEEARVTVQAAPPLAADVDGDSSPDLVLGFLHERAGGGTSGGALYLLRANATGAFQPPEQLAPIAVVQAVTGNFDGKPGADIAALHRANSFARRPSEVWVFGGGPAPSRIAQLRTGVGGAGLAAADLDGDGHEDLVALTTEPGRIDVFYGDGAGRFPRSATLAVPGARAIASGDLNGKGTNQVLVQTQGWSLLTAPSPDVLDLQPLHTPEGFFAPQVVDVDGDGHADLVGIAGPRVVWLRRPTDAMTFETSELLAFAPTAFIPKAVGIADLNADGKLDAVVLGRTKTDGPWELVVLSDLGHGAEVKLPATARPIPDAPLTLQISP